MADTSEDELIISLTEDKYNELLRGNEFERKQESSHITASSSASSVDQPPGSTQFQDESTEPIGGNNLVKEQGINPFTASSSVSATEQPPESTQLQDVNEQEIITLTASSSVTSTEQPSESTQFQGNKVQPLQYIPLVISHESQGTTRVGQLQLVILKASNSSSSTSNEVTSALSADTDSPSTSRGTRVLQKRKAEQDIEKSENVKRKRNGDMFDYDKPLEGDKKTIEKLKKTRNSRRSRERKEELINNLKQENKDVLGENERLKLRINVMQEEMNGMEIKMNDMEIKKNGMEKKMNEMEQVKIDLEKYAFGKEMSNVQLKHVNDELKKKIDFLLDYGDLDSDPLNNL